MYQTPKPTSLQIHQGNPGSLSNLEEYGFWHKDDPNSLFASPGRLQKILFVKTDCKNGFHRSRENLSLQFQHTTETLFKPLLPPPSSLGLNPTFTCFRSEHPYHVETNSSASISRSQESYPGHTHPSHVNHKTTALFMEH